MRQGNYWTHRSGNNLMLVESLPSRKGSRKKGSSGEGVNRTTLGAIDDWDATSSVAKGYLFAPFGEGDEKAQQLRYLNENNHLSSGIIDRKMELLWGDGPSLMTYEIVDGKRKKKILLKQDEPEVYDFLKRIDYKNILLNCSTDYYSAGGYWMKFVPYLGSSIGVRPAFKTIEYMPFEDCKFLLKNRESYDKAGVMVWDFINRKNLNPETYHEFDRRNPDLKNQSIGYFSKKSFARKLYSNPSYEGTIDWIERSTAIPKVLRAFSDNSLSIKWHVRIPASYWDKKREDLQKACQLKNKVYKDSMLDDLKDDMIAKLGETFSGQENTGKFLQSDFTYDGKQVVGWEITPLDMKIKDFVDAYLAIGKEANIATAAGMNLHPSLSNIGGTTANSGSEIIQSLQVYFMSGNAMHESIVTDGVNTALEIQFPDKDVFVGFLYSMPQMDQNVTPKKRTTHEDNIQ